MPVLNHAKVTSRGEKLSDTFIEYSDDKLYSVNSFGQIFLLCKIIGYADNHGIKSWRFESVDYWTTGYKFSVFERNFSVLERTLHTEQDIYRYGRRRGHTYGTFAVQSVTRQHLVTGGIGEEPCAIQDETLRAKMLWLAEIEELIERSSEPFQLIRYELDHHPTINEDIAWAVFKKGINNGLKLAMYLEQRIQTRRLPF